MTQTERTMHRPRVHVVGAGLSGLSAAVHASLDDRCEVVVHEASTSAGGRHKAVYDQTLGRRFDAAGFFLLAGWRATRALIDLVGASAHWRPAPSDAIAFADMLSGERWTLSPDKLRNAWRWLDPRCRPPHTWPIDLWRMRRIARARSEATLAALAPKDGAALHRLWRPFSLCALNAEPSEASARLAASLYAEWRAARGGYLRLLWPRQNLARGLIEPAVNGLARRGATVRYERRLTDFVADGDRLLSLEFEFDRVDLEPDDAVILATPPATANALIPHLGAPQSSGASAIVHFDAAPPPGGPPIVVVVNGVVNWVALAGGHILAGIQDAAALLDTPREDIAEMAWEAAAALTGLPDALPAWRVIWRRDASFDANPEQDAQRPGVRSPWRNLFLAGAYVQNGLPDGIESAVRSGARAAELALKWAGR